MRLFKLIKSLLPSQDKGTAKEEEKTPVERNKDTDGISVDSLIFDLDGTLWDPSEAVARAENRAAAKENIICRPFTPQSVSKTFGLPEKEVWKLQNPELKDEHIKALRASFPTELMGCLKEGMANFHTGVVEGLNTLKTKYPLYLVSNCTVEYLECFFAWSGLQNLFLDSECFGRTQKSKADNIKSMVLKHRLHSPVYIGDTASDQRASAQAGIPYFHMSYGFGQNYNRCLEFESFDDLVKYLMV